MSSKTRFSLLGRGPTSSQGPSCLLDKIFATLLEGNFVLFRSNLLDAWIKKWTSYLIDLACIFLWLLQYDPGQKIVPRVVSILGTSRGKDTPKTHTFPLLNDYQTPRCSVPIRYLQFQPINNFVEKDEINYSARTHCRRVRKQFGISHGETHCCLAS